MAKLKIIDNFGGVVTVNSKQAFISSLSNEMSVEKMFRSQSRHPLLEALRLLGVWRTRQTSLEVHVFDPEFVNT
jgi:hypothetical protein